MIADMTGEGIPDPNRAASPAVKSPIEIRKILVAVDFTRASVKAVRHGIALARQYGAMVYLVHVVEQQSRLAPRVSNSVDDAVVIALQKGERLERQLALHNIEHALLVKVGSIPDEIAEVIAREEIDLVVVGTRGRTGIKKLIMGSVAERIFRNAPCPVLTVGPGVRVPRDSGTEYSRIIVPTDFSPASRSSFAYACFIARRHQAKLTLVNVLDGSLEKAEQLVKDSQASLRECAAELEDLPFDPELLTRTGPLVDAVLRLARKQHADLIVLGVRSPAGMKDHAMWPNAYGIAARASCPVLTVHDRQL